MFILGPIVPTMQVQKVQWSVPQRPAPRLLSALGSQGPVMNNSINSPQIHYQKIQTHTVLGKKHGGKTWKTYGKLYSWIYIYILYYLYKVPILVFKTFQLVELFTSGLGGLPAPAVLAIFAVCRNNYVSSEIFWNKNIQFRYDLN